jgi:hypothetical protein
MKKYIHKYIFYIYVYIFHNFYYITNLFNEFINTNVKKVFAILIFILTFISNLFSQPDYINFQSVIRDNEQKLLINKSVSLRISLLKNSAVGSILYREYHNVLTNSNGIVTIQIGSGSNDIGNYTDIDWSKDNIYVRVEIDINNTGNYIDIGTTQLLSVPYALFAKSSSNSNSNYTAGEGIRIENNVISNTKQDKEVSIIGTNGIGVSGSYPNFVIADTSKTEKNSSKYYAGLGIEIKNDTIFNISMDKILLLNGSNGIQISGDYPEFTIGMTGTANSLHPFDSTNFLIKGAQNISSSFNDTNFNVKGARVLWLGDKAAFRAGWTRLSNDPINEIDTTIWDCDSIGIYSAAFGNSNLAKGMQSFATGKYNKLYGENSFATGYLNIVRSRNGVAFGDDNEVSAENSMAIGNNNLISGMNALTLGLENVTTHPNSINSGWQNLCEAANSLLIGSVNIVSGNNSASIGYSNLVTGESSVVIGAQSRATGGASLAVGMTVKATGYNSIAMGNGVIASGERSVAMGTSANTNNKMGSFVFADGNIDDISATANDQMTMRFIGGYRLYTNTSLTSGVILNSNGNSWATISDSTKKENFIRAEGKNFLNKIANLKLGSWNYKGENSKTNRHYGAMAQEIFSAFGKDAIGTIGNDTTIASADMDGIMMITLQELIAQNVKQAAEINILKVNIKALLEELIEIKAKLEK